LISAVGEQIRAANRSVWPHEYYMVRDIDAVPAVFSAADLLASAGGDMQPLAALPPMG